MKVAGSPVAPRSPAVSVGLVAADRAFDTRKLEPIKVGKSGQGKEKIRYANGDEFEGPTQWAGNQFSPQGLGTYLVAATGALYEGTFKDGQLEGEGSVTMPNGDKTVGRWEEGKCIGTMTYKNGDSYTGKIERGVRNGKGITTYVDGTVFDGTWVQDVQHGQGKLCFTNGDYIEGMWEAGSCRDGVGRRKCDDGSVYSGQMSAVSRHVLASESNAGHRGAQEIDLVYTFFGKGECQYRDGSRYEGEWRGNMQNGEGSILHPDGNFFTGVWTRGKPQRGSGTIHSDKGWVYEGGILRSMRHGEGVCSWPELGVRYQGEFKNDRRSGRGVSVIEKGFDGGYAAYDGMWEDDVRSGMGEMFWPCGSSYTGEWHKDRPHGRGQATFAPDGRTFEGGFDPGPHKPGQNAEDTPGGVPCGRGRLEFPWGDVYSGEIQNGRPHGMGKLHTPSGDFVEGIFEDGYAAKNCSGRRCFDDGSLYIGDLHGFMPNGLGKLVSVRGDCYYQGSFLDGEPSGTGTFVKVKRNANGEEHETVVWRGSFKEGQPVLFENGKASRVTVEGWPL